LVALLLVVGGAPPLLVRSGLARDHLETAARLALGRDVSIEALRWTWLPPRLVVAGSRVAGPGPDAPPLLEAAQLVLHPALPPLQRGVLRFRTGELRGARVSLARTAEGLGLPRGTGGAPPRPAPRGPLGEPLEERLQLHVEAVELREGQLVFEDLLVSPPVRWSLRLVRGSLRAERPGQPLRLVAQLAFADGGGLELSGARVADLLDLEVRMAELDLARVQPYLDDAVSLAGRVSGELRVTRVGGQLAALSLEAEAADARLRLGEARVAGPVRLRAQLAAGAAGLAGSFGVDAVGAALDFGGAYRKPAGEPARLEGRIALGPDARLRIDELELRIGRGAQSSPRD
jgi:hypothetical protein